MSVIESLLSPEVVRIIGWTLVHSLWQGVGVALLLVVMLAALRRRSANARYVAACAALLLMAMAGLLTAGLLSFHSGTEMGGSEPVSTSAGVAALPVAPLPATVSPAPGGQMPRPVSLGQPAPTDSPPLPARTPWRVRAFTFLEPILAWIVLGWLVGVIVLSMRLLGGWAQAERLKRCGTRLAAEVWRERLRGLAGRLRVTRPVRLLESTLAEVPTAIGWLRPVILIPTGALTGLTPGQLEALLAHELAHIRRYDYLVNVLQTVIETLLFYHPAVWWISRRIRTEREHCCDDLAVAACGDALVYARALATLEERRQGPARLAVAANGGSLLDRVRRVVRRPGTHRSRAAYWLAGMVTLAAATLTGAVALRDSPPAVDPQVTALWERIRAANSAWLDPAPAAITIHAELLEWDYLSGDRDRWRPRRDLEIMASTGRNACFLARRFVAAEQRETEWRYARGVGGLVSRVPQPPSQRERRLQDAEWLAARIGVPLWTSMHQATAKGLPPGTTIDRAGDLIIVRIKATPASAPRDAFLAWNKWRSFGPADYGVLPTSSHDITVTPTAIEWELDAATFSPRRLLEHGTHNEIVVEFGKQWLPCGSGAVPQRVVVHGTWSEERRIEITYEMQCVDSAWVVKQALKRVWSNGQEIESLAERVETREVSLAPIDPARFELPTDVELPQLSYTELGPGERIVTFRTADGMTLEGKLSLPPNAGGPVPVAMLLPGSGPWTFDRPVRIPKPNTMWDPVKINYLDLYAEELTARGLGFFRVNKRGCAQIKEPPHAIVRRAIFSKTTPSVLLDDYAAALAALRSKSGVDADRIVLMGISEGTVLAPRLARRSPAGVTGLVLASYAEDNTHDTIVWQCTVGPWRNMARVYDLDGDDRITREEWHKATPDTLFKMRLGSAHFEQCDRDRNGVLEPKDLAAANAPRLEAILKAVKEADDEWLWWNLVKLNTAHLRAEWDRPPLHEELLRLNVPIHIVHGTHDGAVRVEGVRATEAAFRRAGRTNLVTHVLPRVDHDLNYGEYLDTYFAGRPQAPAAMKVMFDAAAEVAGVQPRHTVPPDEPTRQDAPGTEPSRGQYEPIPAESGPTNTVTGIVIDEDGQPVADTPVLALFPDSDSRRKTRTDRDGRFVFGNLEPEGFWLFSVDDPRFARQWERETYLQVPCERLDLPLRLQLHKPRTLTGVVVNEGSEPVGGVTVTLAREFLAGRRDPVQGWLAWDLQVTETDGEGRFRLERLRPGKVVLVLDHPDYARTISDVIDVPSDEPKAIIKKGLTLRGRVIHDGEPRAGVKVTINAINLAHRSLGHWQVTTNAAGEFRVDHVTGFSRESLAYGSSPIASVFIDDPEWNSPIYQVGQIDEHTLPFVEIEARPGAADLNTREMKKVGEADPGLRAELSELPSGEAEIKVRLEPAPDESGRVPEVCLSRLTQEENEQLYLQESPGPDGVAAFKKLPAGTYRVGTDNYKPPNYAPKYVAVGEGKRVEVVLRKGPAKLTGVVRSGGQRLNLRDLGHAISCELPSLDPRIGTTRYAGALRDDGSYEIDGLAYGRYLVTVMLAGSWPYTFAIDTREPDAQRDVELPSGRITGKVVAELPPQPPEEGRPAHRVFVRPRDMLGSGSASPALDEQQEFRLEHVPEGTYVISFPVPGKRNVTSMVQLKRPGDHVHAELEAPEQTGWIAGAIAFADADVAQALSDRDRLAVCAVLKEESGYNFRRGRHTTVERGAMSYRLTDVPPGTYAVSVMSLRSKVALTWIPDVEVRAGLVRTLDITIPQGREVRILPGYQGEPPSALFHWRLQMPTGDWIPYGSIVGSHGQGASAPRSSFVLPFGQYVVEADFGGSKRVTQAFTVEPGEGVQEILVRLPSTGADAGLAGEESQVEGAPRAAVYEPIPGNSGPTSTITGIVIDEDDQPVGNAPVFAVFGHAQSDVAPGPQRTARSGADGRFVLEDLKPDGLWCFSVNDPRFARQWEYGTYVELPTETLDLPLKIRVHKPRSLNGVVVNESGAAVPGVRVTLAREWLPGSDGPVQGWLAWDLQVTGTDADGRFRLERLRPGKVVLVLDHPDYARTITDALNVGEGDARVTINKGLTLRGRVVHDGKPLEGVRLRVSAPALAHRSLGDWEIQSDAAGEFTVEHVSEFSTSSTRWMYTVSVCVDDPRWYSPTYGVAPTHDGTLPFVEVQAGPKAEEAAERGVIRMGGVSIGKAAEQAGQPLGDSTIEVEFVGDPKGYPGQPREIRVMRLTDEEPGRRVYRVGDLDKGLAVLFEKLPAGTYYIQTDNRWTPNYPARVVTVAEGQHARIRMEPGPARIAGIIRSAGQRVTIPKAEQAAASTTAVRLDPIVRGERFQGQVFEDGTYEVAGIPFGWHVLTVNLPGSWPHHVEAEVRDADTRVDVDLPQGRISGTVVGELPPAGERGLGPHVMVLPRDENARFEGPGLGLRLDEDQSFALNHVPPGVYTLRAFTDGNAHYLPVTVRLDRFDAATHVELRAAERTGWIAGTVTAASPAARSAPAPVESISVYAIPKDDLGYDFSGYIGTTVGKDESAYRLKGLPIGTYGLLITSHAKNVALVWKPDVNVREGLVHTLDMLIPDGREIRLRVQYESEHPAPAVWQLCMPTGDWIPFGHIVGSPGVGVITRPLSFTLPFGDYLVEADFGGATRVTQAFTVEPGEGVQEIVIPIP